ncbi:MAG: Gfo/Idh/MocA family oxidoreductase [Planctomycetota bacterium]|nr:Gfo/Idh/MocA family oxidoreductase [Planctomycetota bacterium]MDP7248400.1 Gfo/Idh/MocA family oxidoreductase [Planctomycetota bacterium]
MKPLRIGVVGVKGMGGGHVEAIAASEQAEMTAVADIDLDLARQVAEKHDAHAYADYREMISTGDLDAVVVATPHFLHGPMGLHCLEAGLHTFIEKPIAMAVSEADRLVKTAKQRGLKLAVGHNYRTFPGNRAMKQLIDEGALGEIHRVLWMWLDVRSEAYYERDLWRCTWEHAGGGVLMNQVSHDIDLICWMFGDPVQVSAQISNWSHKAEIEDTAIASVLFASGAHASLQFSINDRPLNYRQVSGSLGALEYRDEKSPNSQTPDEFRLGRYETPMRDHISQSHAYAQNPVSAWEDVPISEGDRTLFQSFIDAILDGGDPITDGATALRSLELINAIILSGVRKEVVDLPLDRARYDELLEELKAGKTEVFRHTR